MSKKNVFIYSTLSCAQEYTLYKPGGQDLQVVESSVTIAGGANVTNKKGDIPPGVVTTVTTDQLELLRKNHVFNQHVENGYIIVSETKPDVEVAAADMTTRSPDAPLETQDFDLNNPDAAKPMGLAADPAPRAGNARRA